MPRKKFNKSAEDRLLSARIAKLSRIVSSGIPMVQPGDSDRAMMREEGFVFVDGRVFHDPYASPEANARRQRSFEPA